MDHDLITALAHPARVAILEVLNEREASPKELTGLLPEWSLGQISYHVNILAECKCVVLTGTMPKRGAVEHFYRAEPRSYIGDQDWRKVPLSVRRTVTVTALRSFISRVTAAIKAGTLDQQPDTTLNWFTVAVDRVGRLQVAEIMSTTRAQVQMVHVESRQRAAAADEKLTPFVIGLAAFQAAIRRGRK